VTGSADRGVVSGIIKIFENNIHLIISKTAFK